MKHFSIKRLLSVMLLFVLTFLVGCRETVPEPVDPTIELTIISVNDFHGQLEEKDGKAGAARMAEFIYNKRASNPDNTILLSAGDMFQGTGISNINYGSSVIELMNMLSFDAMTIGNHEFDWDLDTILSYRDGDVEDGEANFPFLGANIFQKSTQSRPDNVEEYTIIERSGLKIAIIGFLGYDQVGDIATDKVADYEFLQPLDLSRELVKKVRTEEGADVVIICCHEDNTAINNMLASGQGEYQVDAIINGHTHNSTTKRILRDGDNVIVPIIQSGSSGEYVGVTTLKIERETKKVLGGTAINHPMSASQPKNANVEIFVNNIVEFYAPVFQRVLVTAGSDISRLAGINWATKALYNYANLHFGQFDLAVINNGGIRNSAFPIRSGEAVTVNRVYQIMPFDNTVKTVEMLGKDVKILMNINDLSFYGSSLNTIEDNTYYKVIAVDYIFDKADYPFKNGINQVATGILFRDILINDLEISAFDGSWYG